MRTVVLWKVLGWAALVVGFVGAVLSALMALNWISLEGSPGELALTSTFAIFAGAFAVGRWEDRGAEKKP